MRDKIFNTLGQWGKPDLAAVTICSTEAEANRIAMPNTRKIKYARDLDGHMLASSTNAGNKWLNQFRHTQMNKSREQIIEGLQGVHPDSNIYYEEAVDVFVIDLT